MVGHFGITITFRQKCRKVITNLNERNFAPVGNSRFHLIYNLKPLDI